MQLQYCLTLATNPPTILTILVSQLNFLTLTRFLDLPRKESKNSIVTQHITQTQDIKINHDSN